MNDVRDAIANGIANGVGWLVDAVTVNLSATLWVLLGLGLLFVLWRLSLVFGPKKICRNCRGKGYTRGFLGGKKECAVCDGKALVPRVWSGGDH